MKIRRFVAGAAILCVGIGASRSETGAQAVAQEKIRMSVTDAAMELAARRVSAAFVLQLPEELEEELALTKASPNLGPKRTGFDLLIGNSRSASQTFAPEATPEEILTALSKARRPLGTIVPRGIGRPIAMLKEERTAVCRASLRQRTHFDHTDSDLWDLLATVVNDATGAHVPELAGGCVGAYLGNREPVLVRRGETLEDALNAIVSQYEGSTWIAVESAAGECSLGFTEPKRESGICVGAIAEHLGAGTAR